MASYSETLDKWKVNDATEQNGKGDTDEGGRSLVNLSTQQTKNNDLNHQE